MKLKLSRGKTLPIPTLDFSSFRFNIEIEADSWEEADKMLKELEQKEMIAEAPDYIKANDKLASLKEFVQSLIKDPRIGTEVKARWTTYVQSKQQ